MYGIQQQSIRDQLHFSSCDHKSKYLSENYNYFENNYNNGTYMKIETKAFREIL